MNRGSSPGGALVPVLEIKDIEDLQEDQDQASGNTAEVAPTSAENEDGPLLSYVVCTTQHGRDGNTLGRVHTINPVRPEKTMCGWRFTETVDHIISECPFPSEGGLVPSGARRCTTCVKREEQTFL